MKNGQPHFQDKNEFKKIYLLSILHVIHYRLSIDSLLQLGLEFNQIARLLSEVIQKGLVDDFEKKGLQLTTEGIKQLEKLNKDIYSSNPQSWILPSEEFRIPRIGIFDIYLPRKKKY